MDPSRCFPKFPPITDKNVFADRAGCSPSTLFFCFHCGCRSTCLLWRLLCCVNTQQTDTHSLFGTCRTVDSVCKCRHVRRVIRSENGVRGAILTHRHHPFGLFVVLLDIENMICVYCCIYKGFLWTFFMVSLSSLACLQDTSDRNQ